MPKEQARLSLHTSFHFTSLHTVAVFSFARKKGCGMLYHSYTSCKKSPAGKTIERRGRAQAVLLHYISIRSALASTFLTSNGERIRKVVIITTSNTRYFHASHVGSLCSRRSLSTWYQYGRALVYRIRQRTDSWRNRLLEVDEERRWHHSIKLSTLRNLADSTSRTRFGS